MRFGSEIKALLADPAQYRRLSAEGVHRFLARGYSGPTSTTLEGIQQVPPGTVMTFTSREQSSRARPMAAEQRRDLLEIMEDRHARGSTVVTSQLPVEHWHETIGHPTIADAILDRLVHNAHRLSLKGESLRKAAAKRQKLDGEPAN